MTDEELARAKSIEHLTEEERQRFFHIQRRFHGVSMDVYSADDTSLIYRFSNAELRDVPPGHGISFTDPNGPQFVLVHIHIGPWEFWQDVRGTDVGATRQYNVSLP
jgi:hypothetical protein